MPGQSRPRRARGERSHRGVAKGGGAVADPKDLITSGRAVQAMQYYADNATTNADPANAYHGLFRRHREVLPAPFRQHRARRALQRQRRPPAVAARIPHSIGGQRPLSSGDGPQSHQYQRRPSDSAGPRSSDGDRPSADRSRGRREDDHDDRPDLDGVSDADRAGQRDHRRRPRLDRSSRRRRLPAITVNGRAPTSMYRAATATVCSRRAISRPCGRTPS